jgi:hypothetical protein
MTDEQIAAALAEVGAAWLMDELDDHGQPNALRHLVAAAAAAERERCARLCETMRNSRDFPEGWGPVFEACAARIRRA